MITDRKAFYAYVLIGATALFGLSMATVWAQSEEADPSGQTLELNKNEPIGGPFSVGFTGSGSGASATTVDNNQPTTGEGAFSNSGSGVYGSGSGVSATTAGNSEPTTPSGAFYGTGSGVSATTVDNSEPATPVGAFSDQDSGVSAETVRNNTPTTPVAAYDGRGSGMSATTVDNNKPTTGGSVFYSIGAGGSAATEAATAGVTTEVADAVIFATNSIHLEKTRM